MQCDQRTPKHCLPDPCLEGTSVAGWPHPGWLGLGLGRGMYCIARAYSLVFASVVALFEYVTLPINVMWSFLLWQQLPTWTTWVGAGLTLFSGLYILARVQKVRVVKSA